MNIQSKLNSAIASKLKSIPAEEQRTASAELSNLYRNSNTAFLDRSSKDLFLGYVGSRMPATFAVISRILAEYKTLCNSEPRTFLDIGAGPATAAFAALEHFNIQEINLFEKQDEFRILAQFLSKEMECSEILRAKWHMGNISELSVFPSADLAIASYSLGEMPLTLATKVTQQLFDKAQTVVLIEPGTPKGFERIFLLRDQLIKNGAQIVAPCPHQKPCPMKGKDFCHFKERLAREKFHRESKGATLPYEDESFSYLIATKTTADPVFGRIIRKPMKRSGHVTLDICTDGQILRQTVTRKDKARYKFARDSTWGDIIS